MSFTRKEKRFCVLEFNKNKSLIPVELEKATRPTYDTENLKRRDVCAPKKRVKCNQELAKTFISLLFEIKFSLRKLKIISFQKKV